MGSTEWSLEENMLFKDKTSSRNVFCLFGNILLWNYCDQCNLVLHQCLLPDLNLSESPKWYPKCSSLPQVIKTKGTETLKAAHWNHPTTFANGPHSSFQQGNAITSLNPPANQWWFWLAFSNKICVHGLCYLTSQPPVHDWSASYPSCVRTTIIWQILFVMLQLLLVVNTKQV